MVECGPLLGLRASRNEINSGFQSLVCLRARRCDFAFGKSRSNQCRSRAQNWPAVSSSLRLTFAEEFGSASKLGGTVRRSFEMADESQQSL